MIDEDWTPADEDGLAILVGRVGLDAVACLEMMSGAAWVRDQLAAAGWTVQIADARKAKAVGSLAAKTDKRDARVLLSWLAAIWSRRCTFRRSATASSRSASGDACTWFVCERRR